MSQSAVVAVAAAFIVNGLLTWLNIPGIDAAISWIVSGAVAFVAGWATMNMGKK
jgi:hypothetical protein